MRDRTKPLQRKRGVHLLCDCGTPGGMHLEKCQGCPSVVPKPCNCGWTKFGRDHIEVCHVNKVCTCMANPLDEEDFTRMNLPKSLWDVALEGITEPAREAIKNFSGKIQKAYENGVGLYISGERGRGKTSAAIVALKEARAWGFPGYCISVSQLRDAIRAHASFDAESLVADRCRTVDFLLLDDLRAQDVDEKFFTINDVRNLIVNRYDSGLPTLVTSSVAPTEWGKLSTQIQEAVDKCCAVLTVTGKDRSKEGPQDKKSYLK